MKKTLLALMILIAVLALASCGEPPCEHSFKGATCTEASICTLCGFTPEGAMPIGHSLTDATCTEARTCSVCGITQGKANGHSWNITKATCAEAKTCTVCDLVSEEALGHPEKAAATCTKAESCKLCGETFGEPFGHTWTEATCTAAKTCSVCKTKDGKPLEHNYEHNECTLCGDKLIESYSDLRTYLRNNCRTLTTAIGTIKNLSFEVVEKDPNWDTHDFEIQIESELYCNDLNHSLDYSIFYGDFLAYEDRIQAAVDILNYQAEIVRVCEEAFPDKKLEVKFYTWGYEYPNIKVGFNSTSKLIWRNWRYNNSGLGGSLATDKVEFTVFPIDFMSYYSSNYQKWQSFWYDICAKCPQFNIDW